MSGLLLNPNQDPIPVPVVTSTTNGVVTPEMLAQIDNLVDNSLLYVSPTGSDSNDGSQSAPLATFAKFWSLATEKSWLQQNKGFFAAGDYTISGGPSFANAQGSRGKQGTPLAMIGAFTNEIGDFAATANSANGSHVIDGGLALGADAYVGYYVYCVSGANAGQRRQVKTNTATDISLTRRFVSAVAINDVFRLQKPSVNFNIPDGETIVFGFNNGYLGLQGINFVLGAGAAIIFADGVHVSTDGVWITGNFETVLVNRSILEDTLQGPWTEDGVDNPFAATNGSCGIYFNSCFIIYGNWGEIAGSHVFDNCPVAGFFPNGRIALVTPSGTGTSFYGTDGTTILINGTSSVVGKITGDDPFGIASGNGVQVQGGCYVDMQSQDFSDMTAAGVAIESGSFGYCTNLTSATPNGTFGLLVKDMAQINSDQSNTITGATGDTSVAGTTKAYGALPFTAPDTLCRIQ